MSPTKIEWTDVSWNPVTGCTKVSQGCKHCYAETVANRFWKNRKFTDVQCHADRLERPLHWRKPRRVFVNSMSDLFHEDVPDEFIDKVFAVMALCRQHTFQILTKRPERMRDYVMALTAGARRVASTAAYELHGGAVKGFQAAQFILDGAPNVWLGVSCEDQKTANERIPVLLDTQAAVRFVSCEPLLGPVDLRAFVRHVKGCTCGVCYGRALRGSYKQTLDWAIVGGESGPKARPMHPDWARSIRDQCVGAGVAYFHKQNGEWRPFDQYDGDDYRRKKERSVDGITMVRVGKKHAGRLLDGREWNEFPGVQP